VSESDKERVGVVLEGKVPFPSIWLCKESSLFFLGTSVILVDLQRNELNQ